MNLANHINDLLYRYNCVIVPDFGGFVTNKIGAKISETSNTFSPPSKQVTFNNHLKVNDGLLANYIALSENISFDKAVEVIALEVVKWKDEIQNTSIKIDDIGVLSLNENDQIIFEPSTKVNYLTTSFGLSTTVANSIERNNVTVKTLQPTTEPKDKKVVPSFIKYAATAAILLTLGFVGNNAYQQNKQETLLAKKENAIQKKIQSATFVIPNPLPTIEINVAKEADKKEITKEAYHVVAGAFQILENAEKKVKALKKQGYNASILGVNKWCLVEVAFNSFADKNDAINNLYKIQKTVSKDAWLLVKN